MDKIFTSLRQRAQKEAEIAELLKQMNAEAAAYQEQIERGTDPAYLSLKPWPPQPGDEDYGEWIPFLSVDRFMRAVRRV